MCNQTLGTGTKHSVITSTYVYYLPNYTIGRSILENLYPPASFPILTKYQAQHQPNTLQEAAAQVEAFRDSVTAFWRAHGDGFTQYWKGWAYGRCSHIGLRD